MLGPSRAGDQSGDLKGSSPLCRPHPNVRRTTGQDADITRLLTALLSVPHETLVHRPCDQATYWRRSFLQESDTSFDTTFMSRPPTRPRGTRRGR